MSYSVVTLMNGFRVVNFSSPHPFTFDCGTIVPRVSPEESASLSLIREDVETVNPKGWVDCDVKFVLTESVTNRLSELEKDEGVDIILVPFPILEQVRNNPAFSKARGCNPNRETKVCSSTKFNR